MAIENILDKKIKGVQILKIDYDILTGDLNWIELGIAICLLIDDVAIDVLNEIKYPIIPIVDSGLIYQNQLPILERYQYIGNKIFELDWQKETIEFRNKIRKKAYKISCKYNDEQELFHNHIKKDVKKTNKIIKFPTK